MVSVALRSDDQVCEREFTEETECVFFDLVIVALSSVVGDCDSDAEEEKECVVSDAVKLTL